MDRSIDWIIIKTEKEKYLYYVVRVCKYVVRAHVLEISFWSDIVIDGRSY